MIKPDWCPQEVWAVVLGLTPAPPFSSESVVVNNLRVETARAILAAKAEERQACAKQVVEYLSEVTVANDENRAKMISFGLATNETDRRGLLLAAISEDLSDAIRKRGEANVSTVRKSENQEG